MFYLIQFKHLGEMDKIKYKMINSVVVVAAVDYL